MHEEFTKRCQQLAAFGSLMWYMNHVSIPNFIVALLFAFVYVFNAYDGWN